MSQAAVVQQVVNKPVSMPKMVQHGVSKDFDAELKKHELENEKKPEKDRKAFAFTTFLSVRKEPAFYLTFDEVLCFKAYTFKTTKEEHKEFFRNLSVFGTEIFENVYPEDVMKRMKKDKDEMTKHKEDGGE